MAEKTVQVPLDVLNQSIAVTSRAGALCEKIAADMSVVKSKAGLVADALIKAGVLDSADRNQTVEMLIDPTRALDITARVADLVQPRFMGQAEKAAEAYDPQHPTASDADRVFAEKINRMSA